MSRLPVFVVLVLAAPVFAQNVPPPPLQQPVTVASPPIAEPPAPAAAVSREEGLGAWARIYEVASHPRCQNCHVGADNIPMWSGPTYGRSRPHGMHISAGESRIGAEYVPCGACHAQLVEGAGQAPHMAPQVATYWQLAPVEAAWFGKSSAEVCAQLSDTDLNGGRDQNDLAEYLRDDAVSGGMTQWGWNPGGGREPAPYSLEEFANDILAWGAAGFPCAEG
ncbi:hypothetical protein [Tropicimonas sp.]|uniref:hypothetical protein n=1 Tax=Tropicimonas sp. TaxID=2067044 RepID=UPI003A84956C